MREKFELASKVVGLVFWALGFITFVCAVLMFLLTPDAIQLLPDSARATFNQTQINELRAISNYTTNRYILILAIVSVFEVLLGVYLMKSNNLFVKLCYPFENQNIPVTPHPDLQLDGKSNEAQNKEEKPSENKYAPPGYYNK